MNRETLYEFIDSKAIREHLIKLNYEFKADEAALIVYQSERKTLEEKHQAYNWIINNMGDCQLRDRNFKDKITLHNILKEYIKIENKLINEVKTETPSAVYTFRVYCKGDSESYDGDGIYKTFEDLKKTAKDYKYESIWIKKNWFLKDKKHPKAIVIQLNSDDDILSVYQTNYLSKEEDRIFDALEDEIWIDIPVPFKKGDILTFEFNSTYYPPHQGPMVFEKLGHWDMIPEKLKKLKNSCWSLMDMTACGYFQDEDKVYYECMHNYLKLDYYDGELEGGNRILKALSNYLKGDIPIDLLMNAYHIIKIEEDLKEDRKYINFLAETLEMAGLK